MHKTFNLDYEILRFFIIYLFIKIVISIHSYLIKSNYMLNYKIVLFNQMKPYDILQNSYSNFRKSERNYLKGI